MWFKVISKPYFREFKLTGTYALRITLGSVKKASICKIEQMGALLQNDHKVMAYD